MKEVILFLSFLVSLVSFSQNKDYNLKKGYVAEGYDVVSYFDNDPIEGKKEFTATHDGVKFRFANAENLKKFKANPSQYVPQYGGWCAYALGANNTKYDINPKTYEIRDDKLYLFYNSWGVNTLKKWTDENPEDLKKKADQNWSSYK
ncbi:YHS domain-containing (seleno)protein [Wenyingzhuangia sp. IMCC45533]